MTDVARDALQALATALQLSPEAAAEILLTGEKANSPTITEYLPAVEAATTPGAAGTYKTYWKRLDSELGDRQLADVKTSDLQALLKKMEGVQRKNQRGGYQMRRSAVQAWRKVWSCAMDDGITTTNPAKKLAMPARKPVSRRGLSNQEVQQLFDFFASTGNDPELDTLLFRFHLETGARRGGAIALQRTSIDMNRRSVLLLEKGGKEREMPVTKVLLEQLLAHNIERGGGQGTVFRYLNGNPLTTRRYDHAWKRVQENPPFPAATEVSIHWARHTAITNQERLGGEAVAAQFAGHQPYRSSVTGLYTTAPTAQVVQTWAQIWDEQDHPLASG